MNIKLDMKKLMESGNFVVQPRQTQEHKLLSNIIELREQYLQSQKQNDQKYEQYFSKVEILEKQVSEQEKELNRIKNEILNYSYTLTLHTLDIRVDTIHAQEKLQQLDKEDLVEAKRLSELNHELRTAKKRLQQAEQQAEHIKEHLARMDEFELTLLTRLSHTKLPGYDSASPAA